MKNLKVLYLQNNPICKKISHYWKVLIYWLKQLKYLDDRPVFDEEWRFAVAFCTGGVEEERKERAQYKRE